MDWTSDWENVELISSDEAVGQAERDLSICEAAMGSEVRLVKAVYDFIQQNVDEVKLLLRPYFYLAMRRTGLSSGSYPSVAGMLLRWRKVQMEAGGKALYGMRQAGFQLNSSSTFKQVHTT